MVREYSGRDITYKNYSFPANLGVHGNPVGEGLRGELYLSWEDRPGMIIPGLHYRKDLNERP
jgi:hypothetical protein